MPAHRRLATRPKGRRLGHGSHAMPKRMITIAAELRTGSLDGGLLEPMLTAARHELAAAGIDEPPDTVLADAGCWSAAQVTKLTDQSIEVLVAPDGHQRAKPMAGERDGLYQHMRDMLTSDTGRGLYRRRQHMIEPVFAQTKI